VDLKRIEPFRNEDDARNLRLLIEWLGEEAAQNALVHAPVTAFDFEAPEVGRTAD
jgi:hypothetical protein